jgi:hypothetical protein
MHKGRFRVQAPAAMPTLDIRIETPAGRIEARGGSLSWPGARSRWNVYCDAEELTLTPRGKAMPCAWQAGGSARFWSEKRRWRNPDRRGGVDPDLHHFEVCNAYFEDLEPFIDRDRLFDRAGLDRIWAGAPDPDAGRRRAGPDVSPTIRPAVAALAPGLPPGAGESGGAGMTNASGTGMTAWGPSGA